MEWRWDEMKADLLNLEFKQNFSDEDHRQKFQTFCSRDCFRSLEADCSVSMRCSYNQHGVEPEYRLYRHFKSFSSVDLCLTVIATLRKTIRGSSEVRIIIYRRIVQDESGKLEMKSGRHAVNFVRVLNSITKCTHQIWCRGLTKVLQGMLNSSLITSR